MDVIATTGLCKCYGQIEALWEVNLRVGAGRLFGFLGPNGAGKTTTLRVLLGLLRATRGTARVLGRDVWREGPSLRREIGYLPGDVRFYDGMSGRANLRLVEAIRRTGSTGEVRRLAECLDLDLGRRVRDYSRGMRQKLGLIVALAHRPRLLILDEPTVALDPLVRKTVYAELRAAVERGQTVLFSSHTLSEVAELCDEVAILRAGRLIEQQRIEVLQARALRRVAVRFTPGTPEPAPLPAGLTCEHADERAIAGTWQGELDELVAWLGRCRVEDVTITPPELDDLFLAYYAEAVGHAGEVAR